MSARLLVLLVAAASLSCDDPTDPVPPGPTPGELTVAIITPHGDDGAIVLRIAGPDSVAGLTAGPALLLYSRTARAAGGFETRAAVFGTVRTGEELRFRVPDTGARGRYSVSLVEVADTANALRPSLSGYRVELR